MIQFDNTIKKFADELRRLTWGRTVMATLLVMGTALSLLFPVLMYAQVQTCFDTKTDCDTGITQTNRLIQRLARDYPDETVNYNGNETALSDLDPQEVVSEYCRPIGQGYCFYNYEDQGIQDLYDDLIQIASSTVGVPTELQGPSQQCSVDLEDGGRVECATGDKGLQSCLDMQQLFVDNYGADALRESCPTTEEEYTKCQFEKSYCFTSDFGYSDEPVCGEDFLFTTKSGEKISDSDKPSEGAKSLGKCDDEREFYLIYNDDEDVPRCQLVVERSTKQSGPGESTMLHRASFCFDDTGLRKATPEQVEQIKEAQREERLERIRQANLQAQRIIERKSEENTRIMQEMNSLVPCDGVAGGGECNWEKLVELANNVIEFLIKLAAIIVVIVIVIAGFKMVTANGDVKAFSKASRTLGQAIGGLIIILLAWLIVDTVMNILLSDEFQGEEVIDVLGSDNNQ